MKSLPLSLRGARSANVIASPEGAKQSHRIPLWEIASSRFALLAMTKVCLRRLAMMIALIAVAVSLTGCAGLQKKFTRKPKETPVQPVTYTEEQFVKPYSNKYYYTTRFTYWRTWQDELLSSLGKNQKRQRRSLDEAISQLEQMEKYLLEPKKSELRTEIENVRSATLELDTMMGSQAFILRPKLEKSRRIINTNFNYEKVKDFVRKDELPTEGGASPPPPAP